MMDVVLKNANHPEYGEVKLHLPIQDENYDSICNSATQLKIRHALKSDCVLARMETPYPMLRKLEGQVVNLDELDYLAKRLDSFNAYEMSQFQALSFSEKISDIPGMINLTFDSQKVTVISDFTDLRQAGIDHCFIKNGGCASTKEVDAIEGYPEIASLINEQAGQVTRLASCTETVWNLPMHIRAMNFRCMHISLQF